MSEILFKSNPGQVSVDEHEGIVECFVAGVGNKDSVGDVVLPGAFTKSLRRRTPRVVWGHDWNHPIGKVLDIYEVSPNDPRLPMKMKEANIGGLYARVQFNLKSEKGREAFSNILFFGMDQEWSIGYKTLDAEYDNRRQANMLKEVELYEVSPVLHGANQLTGTISIKSDDMGEKKEPLRDPKGGLTAAGRRHFERTEGAKLKPGVKGPTDTPTKMRRKGSFLTRFYTNPSGPMQDDNGKPTRLALAAAAWGEPVPKNRSDAAKLAAKGRRLLERYEKAKEKGAGTYGPGIPMDENPHSEGMAKKLGRAIAEEMDTPVKIRDVEENMVIFDAMMNGKKRTFRMGYHNEDDEFMFGRAEPVKARTVYMPMDDDSDGHVYKSDPLGQDDDLDAELDLWLDAMFDYQDDGADIKTDIASEVTAESLLDEIEEKVGRTISRSNLEKLQQAITILREVAGTGGREDLEVKYGEEMMIPVKKKSIFEARMHLDPIFEHYGAKTECVEDGIVVKSVQQDDDEFFDAVSNAMNFFEGN